MKGEISKGEIASGFVFGLVFLGLKLALVSIGLVSVSGIGPYGAIGFIVAVTLLFSVLATMVLGYIGEDLLSDIMAMAALWFVIGFFALMLGFYSLGYYILGVIVVIAATAVSSWIREKVD